MHPVIKWSGSKRSQADEILKYVPKEFDTYYEPVIGGGSVLYAIHPNKAICGDICEPLISLWNEIKNNPKDIADKYEIMWTNLQVNGEKYYYIIRDLFNQEHKPEQLLFLSRTCINGLIRFNKKGKFNSSFHFSRPRINTDKLHDIIFNWSNKIKNTNFHYKDYKDLLKTCTDKDFIYLDPPYFHTNSMYYGNIDYDEFVDLLRALNHKHIRFMLSYDGKRGDKSLEVDLPQDVYKNHIFINSGLYSFNRLQNKNVFVQESLYMNY